MAASIQVSNLPDKIRAQYESLPSDFRKGLQSRDGAKQSNTDDIQLLKFPSTKNVLWDHAAIGEPIQLNVSYYRKPKLCIAEKVLRFAQRHLESTDQPLCSCTLVGSLNVDDDGEGVVLNVERLDVTGDCNSSGSHAAGDMLIPFTLQRTSKERGSTVEDYTGALQLLKQRCCSKDPIDLGNFLLTKGWCSFYNTGEKCVHHLEFDVVTMATEIKAIPINPVPIVPTALSKNLSGPMSISHMQGIPKTGYLTMDHTRKILLVIESDPKVISLPLVGIWVSGVCYAYSAYVWACCLRYLHNSSIQDRVCSPPESFLLVLYNPTHSKPEFYECSTVSGTSKMTFDVFTGYEAVNLSKTSNNLGEEVDVELNSIQNGPKRDLFDAALSDFTANTKLDDSVRSRSPEPSSQEDITPRCIPAPHRARLPVAQSMVPEVSLFFGDGDSSAYVPQVQHPTGTARGLRLQMPSSQNQSRAPTRSLPQTNSSYGNSSRMTVPSSSNSSNVAKPVNNRATIVGPVSIQSTVSPASSSIDGLPHSSAPFSHAFSKHSEPGSSGLPGHVPVGHCGASSDLALSTQYPHQRAGYSYPVPQSSSGPAFSNGDRYTQLPASSHNNQGPRAGLCSCPSCPKPAQTQPYPTVNQYSLPTGHLTQPRPIYAQGFGLPLALHQQQPVSQPRYPSSTHTVYPPSGPGVEPHRLPSNPGGAFSQYHIQTQQDYPANGQVPINNTQAGQMGLQHPARQLGIPGHGCGMQDQPRSVQPMGAGQQRPGTIVTDEQSSKLSPRSPHQSNELNFPGRVARGEAEPVQQNNNSDNSGRSSDDSGLSVTPEKHHSPSATAPTANPSAPRPQQSNKPVLFPQVGINWDNVPPEIYQLLLSQDQQLKELQAQIKLLTAQQALQTLNNSSDKTSSNVESVGKSIPDRCSVAVNTSLQLPEKHSQVSVCMQTSPQKGEATVESSQTSDSNRNLSHSSGSGASGCDGRTPAEIRHRGRLPMNSTQKEEIELDMSQGELVALINNMHDKTIDSEQSDMIVDLPSFQSSPTRSPQSQCSETTPFNLSPRSPISASMCDQEQQDSESETSDVETEEPASTDNPEYYSKLMDNIKKLLSQNTTGDTGIDGYQGDVSSDPSTPLRLANQNIHLGEQLQSFLRFDQTVRNTDTTFIPKINYVSMLLDSDTDTSMEINAMAMKYLKDEQLTQLAKLQAGNKLLGSKQAAGRTALLQKILRVEEDSTPNVTNFGMSPNDMTFATKKYMEKHGLLDGPASGSTTQTESTYNESYQLKTNYSTMSSGSDGPAEITQEVLRTPVRGRGAGSDTVTPVSRRTSTGHVYSNTTTPSNNSGQANGQNSTPKAVHHEQNWMVNGNDSGNSSIPMSHNSSVPQSHNTTPYSHDSSVPHKDKFGANGRYASPFVTPSPARQNHSPPEKDVQAVRQYTTETRGGNPYYAAGAQHQALDRNQPHKASPFNANHGVPNYPSARHQFTRHTDEEDRILDITRLKQLPKLL